MNLSINPTYLCNLRCDFCYLSKLQLSDTKRIDLNRLNDMLRQVYDRYGEISYVDLYGGEISTLPNDYQHELWMTINWWYQREININTNLIKVSPLLEEWNAFISVSFDGPARERWEQTWNNMATLNKPFVVLILASPKVIKFGAQALFDMLKSFNNLVSVEIKPYSASTNNNLDVSYLEYESYVSDWLDLPTPFDVENLSRIGRSLRGEYNAFSDNHLYIQPDGQFAVLDFDEQGLEYFLPVTLDEYDIWAKKERRVISTESYCSKCEYLGRCLTEHYRHVDNVDKSCSGGYKLLSRWDNLNDQI